MASLLVASEDLNRGTSPEMFHYFQCSACGLVFMDPIPADMRPYYEGGYQAIPRNLAELRDTAKVEAYRMKPLLRYKQAGRLLEIGPWMGIFAINAKDAGFDVSTVEIDESCVHFLRETVGVKAVLSADPAAALEAMTEQFDAIVLWHCLEHLRDPWLTLEQAAKRLAPGGILLISIPNIESYEFRWFKQKWSNLDAPRHLYFYPRAGLTALCQSFGLAELESRTDDDLSEAFSRGTWWTYTLRIAPVRGIRRAVYHALRAWATRSERRHNSGPSITAIYQRPLDAPPAA